MSAMKPKTDHQLFKHAQTILTPNEYDTYQLAIKGMSQRTIALAQGISRSSVQSRLDNAHRKLKEYT